jgi:hypothetical protein
VRMLGGDTGERARKEVRTIVGGDHDCYRKRRHC